jgi:hypothetical protein
MTALREFIKVKNREINIKLPNGFDCKEVEVIILPTKEDDYELWSTPASFEDDEIKAFSNHSANNIKEWLDDSEDEIWK